MIRLAPRLAAGILIFGLVFGLSFVLTGSSPSMRFIYGVVLALGLSGAVLLTTNIQDVISRWWQLLLWFLANLFVFDLLTSLAVVKRELLSGWFFIYPAGIAFLFVLALCNGILANHLSKRSHTRKRKI